MFRRRKASVFCADKIDDIQPDTRLLMFTSADPAANAFQERALHQRKLRTAIMRARQLALIRHRGQIQGVDSTSLTTWIS